MTFWNAHDAANPPVAALCASDDIFECCYTDGQYATPVSTINAYIAAGKGILANHERSAGALLGGHSAGVEAANQAMAPTAAWQMPQNGLYGIVYSVDVDIDPTNFHLIADAFDGIRETHAGRWGSNTYGEGALIDYLVQWHKIDYLAWLSASSSYPGYNQANPNVGMYQLVGSDIAGTDRNIVKSPGGLGVWYPSGNVPSGSGTVEGDSDMANIDSVSPGVLAQLSNAIAAQVWEGYRIPTGQGLPFENGVMRDVILVDRIEDDGQVAALADIKAAVAKFNSPTINFDATAAAGEIAASLNTSLPAAVLAALKAAL